MLFADHAVINLGIDNVPPLEWGGYCVEQADERALFGFVAEQVLEDKVHFRIKDACHKLHCSKRGRMVKGVGGCTEQSHLILSQENKKH